MKLLLSILSILTFISSCLCVSALGGSTLVLYDSKYTQIGKLNQLFKSLESRSFEVDIKSVDEEFELFKNGLKLYNNLILLPTRVRSIGSIKSETLLKFNEEGGSVFVVTSPDAISESTRTFLNQLGIFPSPKGHYLVDHFSNNGADDEVLITGDFFNHPFKAAYKGSSALLNNNELLIPFIQAPTTSYTKDQKNEDYLENHWTVGTQGYLAAGLQSLNNARAFWIGSEEFLIKNEELANLFLQWTFQESNVLKSTVVSHHHSNGETFDERPYKISDEIVYQIGVSQWDHENAEWVPYKTDDLQFEVKMLDPYYRLPLNPVKTENNSQIYEAVFKLPDHHGIFTFQTIYQRSGLSFIEEKVVLPIRHLANDEYKRSWEITNSWVYLTSSITVFVGWFVFLILFIYSKDETKTEKKLN